MNKIAVIISFLLIMASTACHQKWCMDSYVDEEVKIYPDFKGVTIPCNIAPLNFAVLHPIDKSLRLRITSGEDTCWIDSNNCNFEIPIDKWKYLLSRHNNDSLTFNVCFLDEQSCTSYRPFKMFVSSDSIDNTLVYRLIPPLYGVWRHMGIYQRNLEDFKQEPIYENDAIGGNCVNCHSMCNRDAQKFLFHMRGKSGATYICRGQEHLRLDTKKDSSISNFVYPYWHPEGDFVAFSVNKTFQVFHNSDPNRIEVIDDASDIVVYDINANKTLTSPLISTMENLETFPAFSPDGGKLYFCSAITPDSLPEKYQEVKYSLLSIDFDPVTGKFGGSVDTLYDAQMPDAKSISFPRPSPDGKWLAVTVSSYGNFSIWHKDADIWLLNLEENKWQPFDNVNSRDVESYHSWSSNSRWMVVSSRRDDGLYTRPYFTHVDENGVSSKPFLLPQKNPQKYYSDEMNSFNIPEFASSPIKITTPEVVNWSKSPAQKVR